MECSLINWSIFKISLRIFFNLSNLIILVPSLGAPSDGTNMIRLDKLKNILKDILKIDQLIKEHSIGNYND